MRRIHELIISRLILTYHARRAAAVRVSGLFRSDWMVVAAKFGDRISSVTQLETSDQ
jgi:hypothetical protein